MSKAAKVIHFLELQKRAEAVGITLITVSNDFFEITDAPNANGIIVFFELDDARQFIRGYELGYASSLTHNTNRIRA